jgi:uncharacterized membrane protein
MSLPVRTVLWLIIPLCLAVVVVYKTVRTDNLRRLPLQIFFLSVYVFVGLVVLGACLYVVQEYWP